MKQFIQAVYQICILLVFPFLAPFLLFFMWRKGIWSWERLGFIATNKISSKHVIWIHGASVGEMNVVMPLVDYFADKKIDARLIVSTMTKTGKTAILSRADDKIFAHLYLPIDLLPICLWVLKRENVQEIYVAETEIWPSFYWAAKILGIPLHLYNARLSPKSLKGYKKVGFFIGSVLSNATSIICQSLEDAKRYQALGIERDRLTSVGNIKNDNMLKMSRNLPLALPCLKDRRTIVFGSLRSKEWEIVWPCISNLIVKHKDLKIVICPRHFDWMDDLKAFLDKSKMTYWQSSQNGLPSKGFDASILIVDQLGLLMSVYKGANGAFVGGSLCSRYGGHNVFEPASLKVPVCFGPHTSEQEQNAASLLEKGGGELVHNSVELEEFFDKVLGDSDFQRSRGALAQGLVAEEAGSLERMMSVLNSS